MRAILIATMVLVIPSFVLFYGWSQIASNNERSMLTAAEVSLGPSLGGGSVEIGVEELELTRNNVASQALMRLFQSGSIQTQEQMQELSQLLRRGVTNKAAVYDLAEEAALRGRAQALGLTIPPEVIGDIIRAQFPTQSEEEIRDILRNGRQTLDSYSEKMAESRLADAGRSLVAERAHASLYELWQEFLLGAEEISVDYVAFSPFTYMRDLQPTEEDLREYFQKNREEFAIPDRVKVSFIKKTSRDYSDALAKTLTPEELRAEFDKQVAAGQTPGREVKARQIFVSAAKAGSEQAALEQARGLKASLALGADFAELARLHSDAPWDQGNTSDLLGSEKSTVLELAENDARLSPEHKETLFSMTPGQISEPFLTTWASEKGAILIQLVEKVDAFEKARERVSRQLATQRATASMDEDLLRWQDEVEDHTTLQSFAQAEGLEVQEAQWVDFPKGENAGFLRGAGNLRDASGLLRILKDDGGLGALKTGNTLIALQVVDQKKGYTPKTVEDDEGTTRTLASVVRRRMGADRARAEAENFLAQARQNPANFAQIATEAGLQSQSVNSFTRKNIADGNLSGIKDFARRTLSAPAGHIALDPVREDASGIPSSILVWHLREKKEPDQEKFRESYPSVQAEYLARKGDGLVAENFQDLLRTGAVKINFGEAVR